MWPRQNESSGSTITATRSGNIDLDLERDLAQNVATATCLILLSLLLGSIARNTAKVKDTAALVLLACVIQWRGIVALFDHLLPNSSYAYVIAVVVLQISVASQKTHSLPSRQNGGTTATDEFFLPPLIFPCRTTHTRLFPTKHSFGYSYLYAGIPIGWSQSAGSLLSTDLSQTNTWYSVHSDDYLARGSDAAGLKSKLDSYLVSQGEKPDEYPYAYLVTAARFLGFSFNPVSFWYLYDKHKALAAMILEVNNTFDERRMYFIERRPGVDDGNQAFANEWTKDFHVSPFNDRDGSYSFTAQNPATSLQDIRIDNNIVLKSKEGKAKIVARVFSTEPAVDPSRLSLFQSWRFVARWWWVGFMTNPRILREARMLWVKKLQVFYRPEVFATSIGRNESAEETRLASLFQSYLEHILSTTDTKLRLEYIPAAGDDRDRIVHLGNVTRETTPSTAMRIKILTPAFYEELVKTTSIHEVFEKHCFNPTAGARTVEVSDIPALQGLLWTAESAMSRKTADTKFTDTLFTLRRGKLRSDLKRQFMPWSKQKEGLACMNDFDLFVAHAHTSRYSEYLNIVARILLADRFALGFMPLLKLYSWVTWVSLGLAVNNRASALWKQPWCVIASIELTFFLLILHYLRAIWVGPNIKGL